MSMPLYVSPEEAMVDRAEFARKGVLRGRRLVAISCDEGVVLVAENPSPSLHKISEIYDRIAFGAVGRYHEFEALRVAGIRQADLRGYSYDRADVTARSIVGSYSQQLGAIFASVAEKPMEVELVVAEVAATEASDVLYQVRYDGTIVEKQGCLALGRDAERVEDQLAPGPITEVVPKAAAVLADDQPLAATSLEVALLARSELPGRTFRRLGQAEVTELLAS